MLPATFILIFLIQKQAEASIYVSDKNYGKVIEMKSRTEPCIVHTDFRNISSFIRQLSPNKIHFMSPQEVDAISTSCANVDDINKYGGFIFPGTKWCGPGNVAESYSDLGQFTEEDKCCREHDHCPNTLEPGQCRHGICNTSPFTRSHCDCDGAFKTCLRKINTVQANLIAEIFFNLIQLTCFQDRRVCPQYMREDSSYTWFCEEWKFAPSGRYRAHSPLPRPGAGAPLATPQDLQPSINSVSSIDANLMSLFEKDSSDMRIMENGKASSPTKASSKLPPALNVIPDGSKIWRD